MKTNNTHASGDSNPGNVSRKWIRIAAILSTFMLAMTSVIAPASARVLFEDDASFKVYSEGITLDVNDDVTPGTTATATSEGGTYTADAAGAAGNNIDIVIVDGANCNIAAADCTTVSGDVITITADLDDADGNDSDGDNVTSAMIVAEVNADAEASVLITGSSGDGTAVSAGTIDLATGTDGGDIVITMGGDGTDATISYNDSTQDVTLATPGGDFIFTDDINANGAVDLRSTSQFFVRTESSAPGSCTEGEMYYNTTTDVTSVCDESTWVALSSGGTPTWDAIFGADQALNIAGGTMDFTSTGVGDYTFTSENWGITAAGALDANSLEVDAAAGLLNFTGGTSATIQTGHATQNVLTLAGSGATNNEDITLDFESSANTIEVGTGTGVTVWDFNALGVTTEHLISTDDADITDNLTAGDITIDEAAGVLGFSGATSASILTTNGSQNVLTLGGSGQTNNEDITLDFESAANTVTFGTSTGVLDLSFGSIDLNTTGEGSFEHLISTDDADINDNLNVGDLSIDEATGLINFTGGTSATIQTGHATQNVLTLAGSGATNNEDITLDFESSANTIEVGTGTGVTVWDFNALGVTAEHFISTDDADINDNLTVGDLVVDEAAGVIDFTGGTSATIQTGHATQNVLTLAGSGATNNEDLTLDFESSANTVEIGTGTGVTVWDFNALGVTAEHFISTDDADINDNLTAGDITIDEAAGVLAFSGATSASILTTNASQNVLTLGGSGETNNEDLTLDFESAANTVTFGTGSGVTTLDFGTINLTQTYDFTDGNILTDNDGVYAALEKLNLAAGTGAANVEVLYFQPEYPDAVIFADDDYGSDHKGTLESLYDDTEDTGYYNWTTTRPTAQNISIQFHFNVPMDYASAGNMTIRYKTGTATAAENHLDITLFNVTDAMDQCDTDTNLNNTSWTSNVFAFSDITTGCANIDPGDLMMVEIALTADNNVGTEEADVGYVNWAYSN